MPGEETAPSITVGTLHVPAHILALFVNFEPVSVDQELISKLTKNKKTKKNKKTTDQKKKEMMVMFGHTTSDEEEEEEELEEAGGNAAAASSGKGKGEKEQQEGEEQAGKDLQDGGKVPEAKEGSDKDGSGEEEAGHPTRPPRGEKGGKEFHDGEEKGGKAGHEGEEKTGKELQAAGSEDEDEEGSDKDGSDDDEEVSTTPPPVAEEAPDLSKHFLFRIKALPVNSHPPSLGLAHKLSKDQVRRSDMFKIDCLIASPKHRHSHWGPPVATSASRHQHPEVADPFVNLTPEKTAMSNHEVLHVKHKACHVLHPISAIAHDPEDFVQPIMTTHPTCFSDFMFLFHAIIGEAASRGHVEPDSFVEVLKALTATVCQEKPTIKAGCLHLKKKLLDGCVEGGLFSDVESNPAFGTCVWFDCHLLLRALCRAFASFMSHWPIVLIDLFQVSGLMPIIDLHPDISRETDLLVLLPNNPLVVPNHAMSIANVHWADFSKILDPFTWLGVVRHCLQHSVDIDSDIERQQLSSWKNIDV